MCRLVQCAARISRLNSSSVFSGPFNCSDLPFRRSLKKIDCVLLGSYKSKNVIQSSSVLCEISIIVCEMAKPNGNWSDEMNNFQHRLLHHHRAQLSDYREKIPPHGGEEADGQVVPYEKDEQIVDSEWEDFEKLLR